jgi:hypothetical protein
VARASLCQKRIDGPYLNTMTSACVAKQRSFRVVRSIGDDQRKRGELIQNLFARLRRGEASKEFLEDQAGRKNEFAALKSPAQREDSRDVGGCIASQRERPDTGKLSKNRQA